MTLSLLAHFDPRFVLVEEEVAYDLGALRARAASISLPAHAAGEVLTLPARTPLEALVHIEAALQRGLVALPSSRVSAPAALDVPARPDLSLALATSGSTGAARHAAFRLEAVLRSAASIARDLELEPHDRIGLLQPMDHGFGLVGQLFAAGVVGAQVLSASRAFASERARALIEARATVFAAVPFGLSQLTPELEAFAPAQRAHVRQIGVAGGALTDALRARYAALFPAASLVHQYGCTEAGPRLTSIRSGEPGFDEGSVGRALPGVRLRVATPDAAGVGEVVFQSPMAMTGYLEGEDACVEIEGERYLRTGDLGRLDADGLLWLVGRIDDVVKLRGEKVSLARVARLAEEAGARAAFACITSPRVEREEGTLAVLYEGERRLSPTAFVGKLPPGVLPKRLVACARMPRLPSGKIDRGAARAALEVDARARGKESDERR